MASEKRKQSSIIMPFCSNLLLFGALAVLVFAASLPSDAAPPSPRERSSFNAGWRFRKSATVTKTPEGDPVTGWRWRSGNDPARLSDDTRQGEWKDATAPQDVFGAKPGFAWFRKTLPARPVDPKKPLVLHFAGVDDNATVYLNGRELQKHRGWDEPFEVPLGAAWKPDAPNELAVLVENNAGTGSIGAVYLRAGSVGSGEDPTYAESAATFDDSGWRTLDLPHDWGVEGAFDIDLPGETGKLPWEGVGWYRKRFRIPDTDKGRRITFEVDGAMSYSQVWLNGKFVGEWPYGYASWSVDLTPFLRFGGENVLAVRLDNKPDSSRWYPGGGIYRNVWLSKTSPVHVAHWGTQVTTKTDGGQTRVSARTEVRNDGPTARQVLITSTILDANGKSVATAESRVTLPAGASQPVDALLSLENARRWSLEAPYRYVLVSRVSSGADLLDRYQTSFGVRDIEWSANEGFQLNGKRVPLNGVCMHHDLGALGAAWNTRAAERQLQILKRMGVNAIRTAHNPPAPEFLDLCDRMGFLVVDEFSDTWKQAKKPNGYARLFDRWAEKDLRAMLRRDRNHPSIIAWSIGNEVGEQWRESGHAVSRFLAGIVRSEDTSRPVTSGNNNVQAGYNGFQKTTDVFGYNYKPDEYAKFRMANPQIPLYGSETASTISSRGDYFFPVGDDKAGGQSDFQMSSYDLYAPPWAQKPDHEFTGQDRNPSVAGEFVWTGFDYLGEPTPYNADATNLLNYADLAERAKAEAELKALGKIKSPARSSYFGIVDLAGFPKDRFYLYQARWRPDLPMAHILPHWNWPERLGQVTPVHVYTSGDEAELFLNGKSQGRRKKGAYEYRLRWDDVVYEPGELRVVSYKEGKPWAEQTMKTVGPAAKIVLEADRMRIQADGSDLSFVTVRISDGAGQTVPRTHPELQFSLSGPGEIVATDNGNAIDLTPFGSKTRKAYNGLALVIVRGRKGQSGPITLRATAAGLPEGEVLLSAQ